MSIRKAINENALILMVSLLCIAAASLLSAVTVPGFDGVIKIFSTLLAVFGGAAVAKGLEDPDALGRKLEAREAQLRSEHAAILQTMREEQKARLMPVNRHLASVTKEIISVVRTSADNKYAAADGLRLIQQQIPNLIGAMTDVGEVAGEPFDPNTIYHTAQQVEELASLLDSIGKASANPNQLKKIAQAQDTLAAIHPDVYKRVPESIDCPYCKVANKILIGLRSPASSHVLCSGCRREFHAHRGKDGRVFGKQPGNQIGKASSPRANIVCPCGQSFFCAIRPDRTNSGICHSCGQSFTVDSVGAVTWQSKAPIVEAILDHTNFDRGRIFCQEHRLWVPSRQNPVGTFTGICKAGPHVLRFRSSASEVPGGLPGKPEQGLSGADQMPS